MKRIPYGRQDISQQDIDAVVDVLASDFLTQGPVTEVFESALSDYCGVEYGVAVNSATSALHVACLALDVGSGDTVWTTPNTFVASANCARYCGADVDFVDIDPRTYNLCAKALAHKLASARQYGKPLPRVVIVVHFAGQSADMRAIARLSEEYGFQIIEDASHAVGARYHNAPVGNCRYSAITVFSFHPVKIITSGEGGMAMTSSQALYDRMQHYRSHGVVKFSGAEMPNNEPWMYEQLSLGFNYRMTDIHAALGVSQLKRLDAYIENRHRLARRYHELLGGTIYGLPYQSTEGVSSLHLYPVTLSEQVHDVRDLRAQLFHYLRSRGLGVNVHYIPVHTQPYYRAMGFNWGDFPVAESYYHRAVSLPLFGSMTIEEQDYVVECLEQFEWMLRRDKAA